MNLALAYKLKQILIQNSSTILTGVGVAGTVGTAVLSGRASFKSSDILRSAKQEIARDVIREMPNEISPQEIEEAFHNVKISKTDTVKLVWREYLPPVGVGLLTVSAIIVAHRIDAKRIVALTLASSVSERAYKEYKDKIVEKLGDKQETKLRDEIAQDRVNNTPGSELVLVGEGEILYMDALTGRYFTSSPEKVESARNNFNADLNHGVGESLAQLHDELGLKRTPYTEEVGWNPDRLVEFRVSATVADNGRPCLVLDYEPRPFPNFEDLRR